MKKYNHFDKWRGVNVLSATFLLTLFLGVVSCKKEESAVGKESFPVDLLLGSGGIDTFSLKTYTFVDDTVFSNRQATAALGMMNDPVMGAIKIGLYAQYELAYLNPNIPAGAVLEVDSFVLALDFNSSYGLMSKQRLEVFEVDQNMYYDTVYRNNRSLNVKNENWVTAPLTSFDNITSVVVGQDTLPPQLRARLNNAKALEVLQHVQNNPSVFSSNSTFKEYLKGLYITASAVDAGGIGMIGSFNIVDKDSKMTIYYKKDGVLQEMSMIISGSSAYYNHYEFDINGTDLQQELFNPSLGLVSFYAKAGRYRGAVEMNSIKDIPKNSIVHSAFLYLPVVDDPLSPFRPASIVTGIYKTQKFAINGSSTGYESYIKGYLMDVKSFVQAVVTGATTENTILISPNGFTNTGNRLIFNGPNTQNKFRPRLVITYTEF